MSARSAEIAASIRADVLARAPEPYELDLARYVTGDDDKMAEEFEAMTEALAMVIAAGDIALSAVDEDKLVLTKVEPSEDEKKDDGGWTTAVDVVDFGLNATPLVGEAAKAVGTAAEALGEGVMSILGGLFEGL